MKGRHEQPSHWPIPRDHGRFTWALLGFGVLKAILVLYLLTIDRNAFGTVILWISIPVGAACLLWGSLRLGAPNKNGM